ncbi:MAG TPA: hypothetical protein VJH92_04575 [Candidatus Nanoarchaeia archaeon]|nr:hypothetical protein [Candidatus Nanoarchaeia archaeon]
MGERLIRKLEGCFCIKKAERSEYATPNCDGYIVLNSLTAMNDFSNGDYLNSLVYQKAKEMGLVPTPEDVVGYNLTITVTINPNRLNEDKG